MHLIGEAQKTESSTVSPIENDCEDVSSTAQKYLAKYFLKDGYEQKQTWIRVSDDWRRSDIMRLKAIEMVVGSELNGTHFRWTKSKSKRHINFIAVFRSSQTSPARWSVLFESAFYANGVHWIYRKFFSYRETHDVRSMLSCWFRRPRAPLSSVAFIIMYHQIIIIIAIILCRLTGLASATSRIYIAIGRSSS